MKQSLLFVVVKFLRMNKHSGDRISNFRSVTMLNTGLDILANILADCLQTALLSLIGLKECCAVQSWAFRDSLNLVHTIKEKVDGNSTLFHLDQNKVFKRVDHGFLENVLSAAEFL